MAFFFLQEVARKSARKRLESTIVKLYKKNCCKIKL